jgi:VCBS repeat-containing protein
MWPDAANHDPKLFSKLARCGQLEICVHGNWHYHWESATVRIDQLRRGAAKQNPAGCDAQPELTNEESGQLSSASK